MAEDVAAAMDVPADRSTRAAGPPAPTATRPAARSRRRRPTGEPPPLPHHLQTSGVGWLVATVVLRRFRQLIIWVVLTNLVSFIGGTIIGPVTQRPRPFGVVIREGWGGWAMPSLHVTFFALGLVAILYTLV